MKNYKMTFLLIFFIGLIFISSARFVNAQPKNLSCNQVEAYHSSIHQLDEAQCLDCDFHHHSGHNHHFNFSNSINFFEICEKNTFSFEYTSFNQIEVINKLTRPPQI